MKNTLRILLCLLSFFSLFSMAEVRAEENPGTAQFKNDFEEIKARLANVEKQQQDIVAKDNLILDKLDQLRVWVHRK